MNALLNEYLLNEVSNITLDFVKNLVAKVKKHDICTYAGHFICDHMLSNNIWVYNKVKEYLELIEVCKPSEKERLIKLLYALFHLIGNADKGRFTFYYPNEKRDMFADDIKNIRYTVSSRDNADLSQLKQVLSDEAYVLLTVIHETFMYSVESKASLQKCFVILRYLLTLSPRHYIQGTTKGVTMDIIDFVFLVCVWYGDNPHCPTDLRTYIALIKDLFYYKLKKKDKLVRINIVFYLIYVILNKRTRNQPIDYDGVGWNFEQAITSSNKSKGIKSSKTIDVEADVDAFEDDGDNASARRTTKHTQQEADPYVQEKCQYLFIYMDYDDHMRYEIDRERERTRMMAKLMRASTKEVEVDSLLMRDPRNDVHITKLTR